MTTDQAVPISLRAYAKLRGVSAMSVSRAVSAGRLKASVVRDEHGQPKIADVALADREWEAATDYSKAPAAVKQQAAERQRAKTDRPAAPVKPAAAAAPSPPAARPRSPADDEPGAPLSLAEESAREKHWRARIAELEFKKRAEELVDAKAMKAQLSDSFTKVRTRLLGLPTRAKQQLPHLTIADIGTLDSLVREALEALTIELEADGATDGGEQEVACA